MSQDDFPADGHSAMQAFDAVSDRERQIREIATDSAMSVPERQARLEALAAEWGVAPAADGASVDDPLLLQISSALTMLAEGGHR